MPAIQKTILANFLVASGRPRAAEILYEEQPLGNSIDCYVVVQFPITTNSKLPTTDSY